MAAKLPGLERRGQASIWADCAPGDPGRYGREALLRTSAKFKIGQVVKHRIHPFRGVIYDVDPEFSNTEEWWHSIPEEMRPRQDQPSYHLLAETEATPYIAHVSQQELHSRWV